MVIQNFRCPLCLKGILINNVTQAKCSTCFLKLQINTNYNNLIDYIKSIIELHSSTCSEQGHVMAQLGRYLILTCSCGFYDALGLIVQN